MTVDVSAAASIAASTTGSALSTSASLAEAVRIGIIQTSLDYRAAWPSSPKIEKVEEEKAIREIRRFMTALEQEKPTPDIILMPELAVPRGFVKNLQRMAEQVQSIIVAGLDYLDLSSGMGKIARNEAAIIVPRTWRGKRISLKSSIRYIGKTYPAPKEEEKLKSIGYEFESDPTVWVFDGGEIGRFGVAICYDFLDIERIAMYRRQIQHLIVLAYNKDTPSFDHAAEATARMVFCNVVICNCGYWGGSLSVSPYKKPERRVIYRHMGSGLATAQVVNLPVRLLFEHQTESTRPGDPDVETFKNLPPGFRISTPLIKNVGTVV